MNLKIVSSFFYGKYSLFKFYFHNLIALKACFKRISSYADFSEDLLVEKIAPQKEISYVDIGAGHPIIGNNTYYFYRKGNKGITIEPVKFHFKLHNLIRKRDSAFNALVSSKKIPQNFYEFSPTQYSTIDLDQLERMKQNGMKPRKIYKVSTIEINKILAENDEIPFFISIDCEGFDYEILKMINFTVLKNLFSIIVEKPNSELLNSIQGLMYENEFKLTAQTDNNLIYSKINQK